jgi:TIR domain
MPDQIFLSHSKDDREIVEYFANKFDDTGIKPVRMEYEKWSRKGKPNWRWIRNEILKSKALFLILTNNIVARVHTHNWVAFEIGVASIRIPIIPVFVFKEENIDFLYHMLVITLMRPFLIGRICSGRTFQRVNWSQVNML